MAIPTVNDLQRPILEITSVSADRLTYEQLMELIASRLSLTEYDLKEMMPSGRRPKVINRIYVAAYRLKKAELLLTEGGILITEQGRKFLLDHPGAVRLSDLELLWPKPEKDGSIDLGATDSAEDIAPDEQIAKSYSQHEAMISDQIREGMKILTPSGFEQLVVILLSKMGYGDGRVTGKSGDHGIDGILTQDPLGLERVYVQAKRWDTTPVSEPEIHRFYGSLALAGSDKGVFITASTFSSPARKAAQGLQSSKTIRLIDGQELADLMITHGVGVITEITYEVKKLDANYFAEV